MLQKNRIHVAKGLRKPDYTSVQPVAGAFTGLAAQLFLRAFKPRFCQQLPFHDKTASSTSNMR